MSYLSLTNYHVSPSVRVFVDIAGVEREVVHLDLMRDCYLSLTATEAIALGQQLIEVATAAKAKAANAPAP